MGTNPKNPIDGLEKPPVNDGGNAVPDSQDAKAAEKEAGDVISDTDREKFDGEILIVDDKQLHIDGLRAKLKIFFGIDNSVIRESLTREKAINMAAGFTGRNLLVFSDVFEHQDMNAVKFAQELNDLRKSIYVVIFTGYIENALKKMPELNPYTGGIINAIINKYGPSVKQDIHAVLNDFKNGEWENGFFVVNFPENNSLHLNYGAIALDTGSSKSLDHWLDNGQLYTEQVADISEKESVPAEERVEEILCEPGTLESNAKISDKEPLPEKEHIGDPPSEPATAQEKSPDILVKASETVMVVEDNNMVRATVVRTLKNRGYNVIEAGHAGIAFIKLKQMKESGQNIDLVLTDVKMPEMDGPDLIKAIRAEHPDMKTLFMSGDLFELGKLKDENFIPKPFSSRDLLKRVREILEGSSAKGEAAVTEPTPVESQQKPTGAKESYPPSSILYSFEDAVMYLPEERKAVIITKLKELRRLKQSLPFEKWSGSAEEAKMRDLNIELEKLGGNSRNRLIEVLNKYEIEEHSEWHEKAFGKIEKEHFTSALDKLRDRFGIPVDKIVVTDRGMGTGRSLRMLIELVKNKYGGEDIAKRFAGNIYGFDLMASNIDKARRILDRYGVPSANLTVGDFTSHISKCLERYKSEGTHLDICLMRTGCQCITEDNWIKFLIQIEKNLAPGTKDRPGGIAIIDTVAMRRGRLDDMRNPEIREKLDDLKNLYPSLWRKYCDDNKHLVPEGVDLTKMRRFPIYDNTTCQGFYWREIATVELFNHIIKNKTLDLSMSAQASFPEFEGENPKNFFTNLGNDFIEQNDLKAIYRAIIQDRIKNEIVVPQDILGIDVKGEEAVDALMDHVAYNMVKGFGGEYIFLERPQLTA